MAELERQLRELTVAWPETPALTPVLTRRRRPVAPVLVALAAVAIAFAVPPARSAILRLFHLGGVTVERVGTLPAAQERALGTGLGAKASPGEARAILGGALLLPPSHGPLHARDGVVSTLLAAPEPVLLSEAAGETYVLKKLAAMGTEVEPVAPDMLWLSGAQHVVFFAGDPPRLAGNVLVWVRGGLTLRLEGPNLTRDEALRLAHEIDGT